MDEKLKARIGRLVAMLEAVDDVEITEEEGKFLQWLSGWDQATVDNFISIIKKVRKGNRRRA